MTNGAHSVAPAVALVLVLVPLASCGPARMEVGGEAKLGDVAITLTGVRHACPCLIEPGRTSVDSRATYVFALTVRNEGDEALRYDARHGRTRAPESTDVTLTAGGAPVAAVAYDAGVRVEGQRAEPAKLGPGDEVRDLFLFDPPPAAAREMVLTVPAALWGREGAVELRLAHEAPPLERPREHAAGEPERLGAANVVVLGADVVLPVYRTPSGAWDTDAAPALAVRFSIAATAPLTYDADRTSSTAWGPIVRTGTGTETVVPAIRYDDAAKSPKGDAAPELRDQLRGQVVLSKGDVVADYALFNVPPPGTDSLAIEFPGSLVGASCAARWRLKWTPRPAPTRDDALAAPGAREP